ncbi:regulatory helix-turn-helix protein, lysR family [Thermoanaerobacter thermohydrosulfuricus]|uniref:Transcriptional regulator n=2 Tax=Thermoanaerobacter thermohydrosulfuricus TaxID=1516 RepID=M8CTW4_THETY|nr:MULTISPECIES: LysR family transcriptional regulator [Thermoanaerobacter]EMT37874.1 Transcriptional regulator [Thermoanaerobacter thermohydrosulfuricus WC1]SDG72581.1 regulatory helix-turn-helix protein, lysR family [Thermoanaerobacter thermohydrosulfuricus]SFE80036.1 regulatory helix-turn-helix protein, lysR family [Thermoanaerobacter thermohydrosulfuricus]
MNLRQLKIFLTVCESGSMSKAAKKLYMTQPSISQTISELEQELNVKLLPLPFI